MERRYCGVERFGGIPISLKTLSKTMKWADPRKSNGIPIPLKTIRETVEWSPAIVEWSDCMARKFY